MSIYHTAGPKGQIPQTIRAGRAAHARERGTFRTHRLYTIDRDGARLIAAGHVTVGRGNV